MPLDLVKIAASILAINLGGYLIGYCSGTAFRFPEAMRRALTLEVGMQNAGLGAMLATTLFTGEEHAAVAIAPAMYTFGCMLTGTILAQVWAGMKITDPANQAEDELPAS